MTGDNARTNAESQALDTLDLRRRRIRVRAWRRGMREMDLILGGFVDARVETLDAEELTQFEALLDVDDDAAFRWFCGAEAPPPAHDTPLLKKIAAFHAHQGPFH
ncbi:MAG: succinate dehydrogenase assembly factor 2 [Methylocystis sp.]|jgi:antitoxin CptB